MVTKIKQSRKTKINTKRTYITFVLDESSSMGSIRTETVNCFNKMMQNIRKNSVGEVFVSLVKFADNAQLVFENRETDVLLDYRDYSPAGWTALFDGACLAVDKLLEVEDGSDTSFLVIVITDGEENLSSLKNKKRFPNLLNKLQKSGNWTFVFQLPPGHRVHFCNQFGVPIENCQEWEATSKGIQEAEEKTSGGIVNYFTARSRGLRSTQTFYVDTDLSGLTMKELKAELDGRKRFKQTRPS